MGDTKKGVTVAGNALSILESFGFAIVYKERYIVPKFGFNHRFSGKEYILCEPELGAIMHMDFVSSRLERAIIYLEVQENVKVDRFNYMILPNRTPNTFFFSAIITNNMHEKLCLIREKVKTNPVWKNAPDFCRLEFINHKEVATDVDYSMLSRVKFSDIMKHEAAQQIFGKV